MDIKNENWHVRPHYKSGYKIVRFEPGMEAVAKVYERFKLGANGEDIAKVLAQAPAMLRVMENVLNDIDMFGKVQPTTLEHLQQVRQKATN